MLPATSRLSTFWVLTQHIQCPKKRADQQGHKTFCTIKEQQNNLFINAKRRFKQLLQQLNFVFVKPGSHPPLDYLQCSRRQLPQLYRRWCSH